jgi:hypothetical protein
MIQPRHITFFFIFLLVLIMPWWIYLPALALAVLLLPFFWEGLVLAFIVDVLYGTRLSENFFLMFPIALGTTLLLVIVPFIQKRFRFYV